jgi:hypothetical protein
MFAKFIAFFGGFLLSSIIDTTISEFQEWNIVGAALIVASIEAISNLFYSLTKQKSFLPNTLITNKNLALVNYLKLGLIYGLIVDAFKLGS